MARARAGRFAADVETAFTLHPALATRWATGSMERTARAPGQPGVRLPCYPDLRQPLVPPTHLTSPLALNRG
ncbi:DUF6207 family protein [Streptomyces sp. NPDC003757]